MYRIFSIIDNRFRAGIAGYAVLSPHRAHVNACQRVYLSSVMILVTFLWNATIDGSISLLPEVAPGRPCSPFSSANIETILRLISGDDTNVFAIETCSPFFFIKEEEWVNKKKKEKNILAFISFSLYTLFLFVALPPLAMRRSNGEGGKRRKKRSIALLLSSFLFLTFSPRDRFLRASCWPSRWKYFR